MSMAVMAVVLGMARTPVQTTQAQSGGVLAYGSKVLGSITVDTTRVSYSFNGNPGDLVTAIADTWTGALNVQIDLVAPDGRLLSQSTQNMPGGDVMGAYLSVVLPDAGVYVLRVSGMDGTTGDFLLTLLGRAVAAATPLVYGQAVDVDVPQNAAAQFFTFDTEDCPTTLVVTNLSEGQPYTFPFVVKVRDQRGQNVALLRGGEETEDWVTVAPRSGRYEVEVMAADPALSGMVRLLVTCSGDNPGCPTGQAAVAGLAGLECRPCPAPGDLVPGGGCPDLHLTVQQGMPMAAATTVFWDAMPGAEGYAVYVYGQTTGGGEVYLTHGEWVPGDPLQFTWILPVPGYTGYRFVLQVYIGDSLICTQEASVELEIPEMQCPDLGLTGAVTDEAVNAVTLNWAAGLGADHFDLVLNSIIGGVESFSGVLTLPGDATSYAFDHFPPDLDGVRLVLWMTRGDLLCSAEITIMFGGQMQRVCPPRNMQATRVNDTTIVVSWDPLPDATQYVFWVEDAGGTMLPGYPVTTSDTSIMVEYSPDVYKFVVSAVDAEAAILVCPLELVIAEQQQPGDGPCAVITDRSDVWVHVGPGLTRAVFAFMEPGVEYRVTGQAMDGDGNPWWRLDKTQFPGHEEVIGLWVMQSDVTELGVCTNIPQVEIPPVIPGEDEPPPGTWGECGSCECGHPGECVTTPEGGCTWDPATCHVGGEEPPPGDGGEDCYRLSTAADPSYAGSVSVLTGSNCRGNYRAGTSVQVSASVIDQKFHFDHWSGCGASGGANPVTITMNSSCTITAHFAARLAICVVPSRLESPLHALEGGLCFMQRCVRKRFIKVAPLPPLEAA